MRSLFWLLAALVTYGSLFPFRFAAATPEAWSALWDGLTQLPGRGDLVANILLFAPFGYVGIHAGHRGVVVLALAAALGAGLQIAQVWLPDRDPSLQDAVWNLAGAGLGVFAARRWRLSGTVPAHWRAAPALLIGCWVMYRWVPYLPSLDFQEIKDSLKPLLVTPDIRWPNVLHDAAAWIAVGHFLGRDRRRLPLMMAIVFAGEVLIANNAVSLSNVAGAAAAAPVVLLGGARRPLPAALLLAAAIAVSGLAPFEFRGTPAPFHWVPFHGFLGGSMLVNAASILEKTFLYGSLLLLLVRAGLPRAAALAAGVTLAAAIEVAQTRFARHLPEVTDPLLVLLVGWLLGALAGSDASPYDGFPEENQ